MGKLCSSQGCCPGMWSFVIPTANANLYRTAWLYRKSTIASPHGKKRSSITPPAYPSILVHKRNNS